MLRWPHYSGQTLVKNPPTPLLLQLIDCRREIKSAQHFDWKYE